jgi:hypothetical protein
MQANGTGPFSQRLIARPVVSFTPDGPRRAPTTLALAAVAPVKRVIGYAAERVPLFNWLPLQMHPNNYRRNRTPFNAREKRVYSQYGEDGIIAAILGRIGTLNTYFVEFGVEDGTQCNTRRLREAGWSGLWMDGSGDDRVIRSEFITAENINPLFEKYSVPDVFDVLSIDIDGNDLWVWKALDSRYRPRLVIIEYNPTIPPVRSLTVPYDPAFVWDKSEYFGASLLALDTLAAEKGYRLICCNKMGTNAFFVGESVAREAGLEAVAPKQAYYPVNLGLGSYFAHARTKRGETDLAMVPYP